MRIRPHFKKGFAMPMILTFIVLISIVGAAIIENSVQTNGSAVLHSQVQIAHIASKAAIDYAEEQYELNAAYAGTAEQDLFVNDFYRATIQVTILYDEGSSAKRVQGIGRVYIPETSSTAKVVRDIKSTIIRNGEVIVTAGQTDPATYDPLLWLDANEPNSLYESIATTNTLTKLSLPGTSNADVVEERGSNASSSKGSLLFNDQDLEMSYDGTSKGNQTIGLRFRSITTPKNATIQNAYIQFTTDETKSAGVVQFEVYGVASDNPSTWSGTYAVANASKTSAIITWQPPNWNTVGASGANERLDVTSIVQELVNRSGWAPNNAMAFGIKWITGSGIRTARSGTDGASAAPSLFIQWQSGSTVEATNDSDSVVAWYDKSGNGNNAVLGYGTAPVLKTNQINGLNAVRFSNNGNLLSSLASSVSDTELMAFMVMRPRTTSASSARFLSLMNSSQNADNNTSNGLIPFMRNGSTTTIQQYYNGTTGRTVSSAIDDTWGTYSSRMSGSSSERLLKNSTPDNYGSHFTPNYTINQIYIGGRRSTASGADYANMDVAEIIVYDRSFICSEIQGIENYLEAKYDFSYSNKDPCP
ncbi:MAG TPA: hypothetical protein PKD20_00935 [Candidatus Saccharibacteria bacterium]|jgi:hypothetical protein|nr:hypothetical protein [Candidatus Saccharibacteria bacterium]HMT55420.1 hypothetical protein [Candidatus Saccharibacteria bacterium]